MHRQLLPVIFSLITAYAKAQQPSFPFWQYTADEGLPSSEVYFIHQDRQGYMWFATDRGLSRFDGYNFRNYGMKDGLQDLVVFQIEEDPGGRLWCYTLSNQIFILENDSIRPYRYNHLLKNREEPSLRLSTIHVDEHENLYFGLVAGGFLRFFPEKNTFEPYHRCEGTLVLLDDVRWKDRSFFVGNARGLAYPSKQEFNRFIARKDSFQVCIQSPSEQIVVGASLPPGFPYQFSTNNPRFIWARTGPSDYLFQLYNTFFYVSKGQIQWTHFNPVEMDCLFVSSDGAIWMGGRTGGGLRRYESLDDIRKDNFQQRLKNYSISHIFESRKGTIWASTLENGVFCIPRTFIESFDERSGLPGVYILDLALKDSATVFFTTQNSFLGELDLLKGSLSSIPLPRTTNYFVYWDSGENRLWTSSNEISYLENGKWRDVPGPYMAAKKFAPLHTPPGIVALTSPFSLILFSTQTKKILLSNYGNDFAFQDRTLCIHQDFSGKIWLGTLNGLKWLNGRKLENPPLAHPDLQIRINALAELPDSTLVIGTQGRGVLLWKGRALVHINEASGLASDIVECLHVGQKGQLWVGSRKGLNKIDWEGSRNLKIQTFSTYQGLPSNQINAIASSGKHIWLGTARGLAHLRDEALPYFLDTVSSAPLIQSLLVGQKPWPLPGPHLFRYWQNDVVIQFSALNYPQHEQTEYRFRLSPSGKWTRTRNRAVDFPVLPPGNYRFELQAKVGEGWSPSRVLEFTIGRPFWRKTWFYAVNAFALLALIAGAWRFTIRRIRGKNERERHILQLERSALQAQMNPHFIFNALNSIQGFIQTGDKKNASRYLAKFARLIRSILQQSRVEKATLDAELAALREYLDLERMRSGNRFEYHIETDENTDVFETAIPPMLIQPFLENAIKHGIGPKEGAGRIDLVIRTEKPFLHVTVRDDGVGIQQSLTRKVLPGTSMGMQITRDRLALLNGEKGRDFVEAEELKAPDGRILGTEIRFLIRTGS